MSCSSVLRGLACVLALTATACASTGAVPRPFPVPGGSASAPPSPVGNVANVARPSPAASAPGGYALVGTALNLRGAPYRNGGSDPGGFDCSGFTQYVFAQHGIALPRDVQEQSQLGKKVQPSDLAMGDLVFFHTVAHGASHVGIAIGGDQFVHAPSSTGVVRVEHLSGAYWSKRFVAARRVNY
jgi:cell wall-associated NlpC family hydrolase